MSLRVIPTRWANYICLFLMLLRGGGSHHFQIFGRKYFAGGTEICLCVDPACQYDSKFTHVHEFAISGKRMGYVAGYRIRKHDHQNAIYHLWERLGDSRFLHQWCFHWLPLFLLQTNKPANKKSVIVTFEKILYQLLKYICVNHHFLDPDSKLDKKRNDHHN